MGVCQNTNSTDCTNLLSFGNFIKKACGYKGIGSGNLLMSCV